MAQPRYSVLLVSNVLRVVAFLRERSLDPSAILREAGVEPGALESPSGMLPLPVVMRVYELAAAAAHEPVLGLTLAQRGTSDSKSYGIAGYICTYSADLRSALGLIEQVFLGAIPEARFRMEFFPDRIRLSQRWGEGPPGLVYFRQEVLGAIFLLSRAMSGESWPALSVAFEGPLTDPEGFRSFFGVEARGNADRDEVVIPAEHLDRPNKGHDPIVLSHLLEALEEHLRKRREASGEKDQQLRLVGAVVDLTSGVVRRGDTTEKLTPRERALLGYFLERANQVVTHDELERHVWGHEQAVVTYAPAVAIRRLRHKVEPDEKNPVNLVTEFGEGWRLKVSEPLSS